MAAKKSTRATTPAMLDEAQVLVRQMMQSNSLLQRWMPGSVHTEIVRRALDEFAAHLGIEQYKLLDRPGPEPVPPKTLMQELLKPEVESEHGMAADVLEQLR